jgi:hypothetical protein
MSLLEGKALHWIEGHLEEYLTKRDEYRQVMSNMSDAALEIFKSWLGFTKHIKAAFGVLNKQ